MRQVFRSLFVVCVSCLFLTGCPLTCDQTCPLNVTKDAFLLRHSDPSCKQVQSYKDIEIPKKYATSCYSCPGTTGRGSETTRLQVSYPNFKPAKNFFGSDLNDGEISIYIESQCGTEKSIQERSDRFSAYIDRNAASKGMNGKERFAPIRALNREVYFQEFINERVDGHSFYFFKNDKGEIVNLYYGDLGVGANGYTTHEGDVTADGGFGFRYRAKGIPPDELPEVDRSVREFVEKLTTGFLEKEMPREFKHNE